MIKKVNRKTFKIRPSGRSTDFISPSFGYGCLYNCSYCYMKRHKPRGLSVATNTEEFLEFINKADRVDIDISPEGVWGNVSISTTALRELVDKHTNQKIIEELEDLKLCHGVCIDLEIEIDEIIKELKQ